MNRYESMSADVLAGAVMLGARSIDADSSSVRRPTLGRFARAVGKGFLALACLVLIVNLLALGVILAEQTLAAASDKVDKRAALPNYQDLPWAETHFREFAELETEHHSFYGWRRRPFVGETVNVDQDGLRRTWRNPAVVPDRTIAIFGGSTAWGSGSDDDHTIASLFAKARPDFRVTNYGDTSHSARQNLNRLLNLLAEGERPDVVVFYNGSSEINKCRVGLGPFSDIEELRIRGLLDADTAGVQGWSGLWTLVYPAKLFGDKLWRSVQARFFGASDRRDCADDPVKSALIAQTLFWDWTAAKQLVEGYGGRFIAAFQPVAYFGQPRTDHIKIDPELDRQYRAVYAQYDRMLENDFPELAGNLLDLSTAFDGDAYIYIDADHVSPSGNRIVAQRLSERLTD
jgi:hypothetical protein